MSELGLAVDSRDPRHLALRAVLAYELGDHDSGAACVARLKDVAEHTPPPGPIADRVYLATAIPFLAAAIPLVGPIASADERLEVAEAAAERVLSVPRVAPVLTLYAKSGLGVIAVRRGDAVAAERLYDALETQRGTASFFCPLTFDRLLGLLAVTFGQLDTALGHFEDGLAFCARAGYRPEYAWAACNYAEALSGRGGPGDRDRAVALRDEALGIARELGMRPLVERLHARR